MYKSHPDVFVACLLPNPPDYAKVGGHWDVLATITDHIKEGTVFLCNVERMNMPNNMHRSYKNLRKLPVQP